MKHHVSPVSDRRASLSPRVSSPPRSVRETPCACPPRTQAVAVRGDSSRTCGPSGPWCGARRARGAAARACLLRLPSRRRRGSFREPRARCARRRERPGAGAPRRILQISRPTRRRFPSPPRNPTAAVTGRRTVARVARRHPRGVARAARQALVPAESVVAVPRGALHGQDHAVELAHERPPRERRTRARAALGHRPVAGLARDLDLVLRVRARNAVAHEVGGEMTVDAGHARGAVNVGRGVGEGLALGDLDESLVAQRDPAAAAVAAETAVVRDSRVTGGCRRGFSSTRRVTWHAEQPDPLPWIRSSRFARRVPRWQPAQSFRRWLCAAVGLGARSTSDIVSVPSARGSLRTRTGRRPRFPRSAPSETSRRARPPGRGNRRART